MNEVQVQVVQAQLPQTLVQCLLDTSVECAPQLGGDKQILPLDDTGVNSLLDTLPDLLFVLVATGAINMTVSSLDGMEDGPFDLTGG